MSSPVRVSKPACWASGSAARRGGTLVRCGNDEAALQRRQCSCCDAGAAAPRRLAPSTIAPRTRLVHRSPGSIEAIAHACAIASAAEPTGAAQLHMHLLQTAVDVRLELPVRRGSHVRGAPRALGVSEKAFVSADCPNTKARSQCPAGVQLAIEAWHMKIPAREADLSGLCRLQMTESAGGLVW